MSLKGNVFAAHLCREDGVVPSHNFNYSSLVQHLGMGLGQDGRSIDLLPGVSLPLVFPSKLYALG